MNFLYFANGRRFVVKNLVFALIFISFSASFANAFLPDQFESRKEAEKAGCQFAPIKGPDYDTCVMKSFHGNQMDVAIYDKAPSGAYVISDQMPITSWYWNAKLSFVDVLRNGTQWLVVVTEGMRGTGFHQRILLVIAWDGKKFRTVAAESLEYRIGALPPPDPTFELKVNYVFEPSSGTPRLRLDYALYRDDQTIGQWNDTLHWDGSLFRFVPEKVNTPPSKAESIVDAVRQNISNSRSYFAENPFDPRKDLQFEGISKSGLMRVLLFVFE